MVGRGFMTKVRDWQYAVSDNNALCGVSDNYGPNYGVSDNNALNFGVSDNNPLNTILERFFGLK